jgi:transcription elongation factor/antiterminator RfaH
MIYWYAFQSKTQKERLLCEQLRLRQIETFLPCIRVRPVNPRARKVKPYFPGYVFGQVDLEKIGKSILDWIPGAIGIVNFGGEPVSVSDHLIHALKQHLEAINAATNDLPEKFQQGDRVTIQGGPFAGYEAIFNARLPGRDRVEVLLKMLQGSAQLRLELSVEQITPRQSASPRPTRD